MAPGSFSKQDEGKEKCRGIGGIGGSGTIQSSEGKWVYGHWPEGSRDSARGSVNVQGWRQRREEARGS